jgi:hypothetical protein
MAKLIVLDDPFVRDQLRLAPARRSVLPWRPGAPSLSGPIEAKIRKCLKLFDKHQGLVCGCPPGDFVKPRELLLLSLRILGHVLHLDKAVAAMECAVEDDWSAHTELKKKRRYRDHITHPVRVTAIGWWFLHRDRQRLLLKLASRYKRDTGDYVKRHGVKLLGFTWPEIVEDAWLACGLLHDSAYPLEHHFQRGRRLSRGFGNELAALSHYRHPIFVGAERRALLGPLEDCWLTSSNPGFERRLKCLAARGCEHAHAVLSALHYPLACRASLHTLQGLIVQLAARAIVSHHDEEDGQVLSDPLATLLAVADRMQAWRRPLLHRATATGPMAGASFRTVVECEKVALVREDGALVARFFMTRDPEQREIMKREYRWNFEHFSSGNRAVEDLIQGSGLLPRVVLSQRRCIEPREFLDYMGKSPRVGAV